jgi:erythromycin esterase-like protein
MNTSPDVALVQGLRETARPLAEPDRHDGLMEAIGDARVVMLGEASHGTHEFYAERARITQRLVVEKGFHAVTVVLDFVRWLRVHDDSLPAGAPRVGFYGLDLYSLHASIEEVLKYLDAVDPQAARLARERYRCFDDFGGNVEDYARSAALGVIRSCEDAVVQQLVELLQRAERTAAGDGADPEEEEFQAVQNARVVKNAEQYYRTMYRGNIESWNLRDRHMAETLEELLHHLDRRVGRSKVVIWEHNSHLGDARATELGQRGGEAITSPRFSPRNSTRLSTWTSPPPSSRWSGWRCGRPASRRRRTRPAFESCKEVAHGRKQRRPRDPRCDNPGRSRRAPRGRSHDSAGCERDRALRTRERLLAAQSAKSVRRA